MLKVPRIEDKHFLKWVASLPCVLCGISDNSQAAHIHLKGQKTKGKKPPDNQVAPLCHDGANGCHTSVDQYKVEIDRPKLVNVCHAAYGFYKSNDLYSAEVIYRSFHDD